MKSLITLALRRPVSIMLAVISMVVFGGSSILSTPMELLPDMDMPMLIIVTSYPNASPEDVEGLVTQRIEDASETVVGVQSVMSESSENMSMVMLELEYGIEMSEVKDNLRGNIDMVEPFLPDDAAAPIIIEMRTDSIPAITLSATAIGDVDVLSYVDEYVVPQIDRIEGVASVDVSGGLSQYVSVEVNEQKLKQYGLTMSTVAQIVGSADFSMPAGSISQGEIDMTMRGGVSYPDVNALSNIPITLRTGDVIYLSDIATIYQRAGEPTTLSRTDGNDDVSLSVTKRQSAATLDVSSAVLEVVEDINDDNLGVKLSVTMDSGEEIINAIISVVQTMALGIVLSMVVLFLFFRDFKASLIVGSSIPISLLLTLIAMQFMGYTFNILSLGGLVIGIGMMVDNSIVVIESCFRMKEEGKDFKTAAVEGANIVAASILASTITTVVVFLPMALAEGLSGQMFSELCFTIVFALLASLLSAVTIVPLVFYRLKPVAKQGGIINKMLSGLENGYSKLLPVTLKLRFLVVIIAIALLAGSFAMVPYIGMELMPAGESSSVEISFDVRPGTSLDKFNEYVIPIEEMVSVHPEVDSYTASINSTTNTAVLTAYMIEDRNISAEQLVEEFREKTNDVVEYDIEVNLGASANMMMGGTTGGSGSAVSIPVQSADYEALEEAVAIVENYMQQSPYIISTSSALSAGNPMIEIDVDPVKAGAMGLMPAQVMSEVYTTMQGNNVATLTQDGREYDIRIEYPSDKFENISDLYSLSIISQTGMEVPLMDIATLEYTSSPLSIIRQDGIYNVDVTGVATLDAPMNLNADMFNEASLLDLPQGVTVALSTSLEQMYEEFTVLLIAILTAVFLVFIVMAMQFESPRFSLIVMFSIPFALVGSFGCLLVFDASISMPSLMGFLMLVGIVVNNGILLIDTTNRLREEQNFTPEVALVHAGKLRLRPILMTTLTTVLAMVPMAIGIGDSAAMMQGMAYVIIGGLLASTVLTLLLIPALYMIITKKYKKRKKGEYRDKKDKDHFE